jgi:ferrous iron transport protein B
MKLSELKTGETAVIVKIRGYGEFRHRITEMGFVKSKEVYVVKHAPLRDPIEYRVMGYDVSLRHTEADLIEVVKIDEPGYQQKAGQFEIIDREELKKGLVKKGKNIHVAFVGNPNAGKTTLFNALSGSHEKVGNYGGVTVDLKQTVSHFNDYTITFVDLPGTYSLSAYSQEEIFVRNYIFNKKPDIVVNVVDSGNFERNLYLTTQLIDMDIKVIMALNMYDEMIQKGAKLDSQSLSQMLGIPMIPTVGHKGKGITKLMQKIVDVYEDKDPIVRHIHIHYGAEVEKAIECIEPLINENRDIIAHRSPRYLAIRALESDALVRGILSKADNFEDIHKVTKENAKRIETYYTEKIETIIADARYGFISGALRETYKQTKQNRRQLTDSIDAVLTHKIFGFPIFFAFMFIMFYATFNLGKYPVEWIESAVSWINSIVSNILPDGSFKDLLTDGIISGVGSVLVFLPNILILFFFISFMEDTGYMARAAFIMDKVMHKMGLHGKSFISLLMGFGCNVPAILSTRMLENKNDRILTMLINPFMSCSARLPVYILIIGAFFPKYPTLMLMGIYLFGILLAVVTAIIFKKTLFKQKEAPFVMELPPYRMPTAKVVLRNMWNKSYEYIRKVGGTILVAVIIIWSLGYFPRNSELDTQKEQEIASVVSNSDSYTNPTAVIDSISNEYKSKHFEQSYLRSIGTAIEPILRPAGIDWQLGVSIVTGIAAKEVIISTLSVIYHVNDDNEDNTSLKEILIAKSKNDESGITHLSALSFLVFVLIYFPCVGVVVAVKKEKNVWKWPLFLVAYTTILAWVIAVIVYQVGSLFL